jgi:hypothetical protein
VSQPARKPSIKSLVLDWLAAHWPDEVDRKLLGEVCRIVEARHGGPVKQRYVLDILASTDVNIARSLGVLPADIRGRVHFRTARAAAESLLEMRQKYLEAKSNGDEQRARDCRKAVIRAKDHLKIAARKKGLSAESRHEKEELVGWFLVWLGSPDIFESWFRARSRIEPLDT